MKCIYCQRVDPPCKFRPTGVMMPVLGQYRSGFVCRDCDTKLRGPDRAAFMIELSYAMRDASDT